MDNPPIDYLSYIAYQLRRSSIIATTQAGSGHVTSCLSAADIMSVCFFYAMRFDPMHFDNPNNDRFILSKGHAAPILYAVWKELGILTEQQMITLRTFDSLLEGHPTPRFKQAEAATGSLGQGLSIGLGIAYAGIIDQRDYHTYVLMGDSEIAEGSIWEAIEVASYYAVEKLIGIVDANRLGQSTETMDDWKLDALAKKFDAFGWHSIMVNGHDIKALMSAFDQAKNNTKKPTVIIAKTIKGYGVKRVEDKNGFHGKAFKKEEEQEILNELAQRFKTAASFNKKTFNWQPDKPEFTEVPRLDPIATNQPSYKIGDQIATRKAFGQAITDLGKRSDAIVCLDAEVKNSTFTELFEEKFPKRFIQCFVAEQNMIGMAVGLATRNKIPFAATFAAFMSRAFDQIRMAAIGQSPLRLCGSHAGVSIGQDGPSQMGLEDIALFNTLPNSVILYPSDAVSAYKLTRIMANRFDGITYLRTTRAETPILYNNNESFEIGGCKIIRQSNNDIACIVAAGITLFEALKAADQLKKQNILVSIIDAYCIKPLPMETIAQVVKKSNNRLITVEDHYLEGGMGESLAYAVRNHGFTITCLAVPGLPRSGTPEKLLSWAKIDALAIEEVILKTTLK